MAKGNKTQHAFNNGGTEQARFQQKGAPFQTNAKPLNCVGGTIKMPDMSKERSNEFLATASSKRKR